VVLFVLGYGDEMLHQLQAGVVLQLPQSQLRADTVGFRA
jgi:hypothetical protein